METINSCGGKNMILTNDVQVVKGVSGSAVYMVSGMGSAEIEHDDLDKMTVSIWRKWDGISATENRTFFNFANLAVYFSYADNKLVVKSGDNVPVRTDVLDDTEFNHWVFTYNRNDVLTIFKNAKKLTTVPVKDEAVSLQSPFILGGGLPHATFDEIQIFPKILEQIYINGLFQFISREANIAPLEPFIKKQIPQHTPRYLGTVKTAPDKQRVNIIVGRQTGFNDANIGDWILIIEPINGYKRGWCYCWDGVIWGVLDPPERYIQEYTACLKDQLELKDMYDGTNGKFFGTVLCQYLGFNEAVGKSLTANKIFVDNLIAKKVLVDNDVNDPTDFELAINRDVGLLAKNNGKKVFEVSPTGKVSAGAVQLLENGIGIKDGEVFVENNGWKGTLRACEDGVEFAILSEDSGGAMTKKQMQTVIRNGVLSLFVLGSISCENLYKNNTAGKNWIPSYDENDLFVSSVAYGNGLWVATGITGAINGVEFTSPDGITWTKANTPTGIKSVAYGNGLWVATGGVDFEYHGFSMLTSPDGITWTKHFSGQAQQLNSVAYGNGLWVAAGSVGTIITSPDGITWTKRTSNVLETLNSASYGNGLWLITGNNDVMLTSPDGITWTKRTSGAGKNLFCSAYKNSIWVVGADDVMLTSPDGITWTKRTSGFPSGFVSSVAYGNGLWVATGITGAMLTSPDGITWTKKDIGAASLTSVAFGNNVWVAAGARKIYHSVDHTITWVPR
ncbi:WD40/YVTN/BNR-like repeat-containing protein [Treponema lecithinolyticum]